MNTDDNTGCHGSEVEAMQLHVTVVYFQISMAVSCIWVESELSLARFNVPLDT